MTGTEKRRLRVVIVDDEPLARRGLATLLAAQEAVELVGEAGDAPAAEELIGNCRPDVAFLDIRIPGCLGTELARRLDPATHVVFTTAPDEFAVTAFELQAVDYLLKPIEAAPLARSLGRVRRLAALEMAHAREQQLDGVSRSDWIERLFVRTHASVIPVPLSEVSRFRADRDYVEVHTAGKSHLMRLTMNSLEERLPPTTFVRVHRSHIVNLDHVRVFRRYDAFRVQAEMNDGTRIVASRTRSRGLRKRAR